MKSIFLSLAILCSAALTAQIHEAGTILFNVNYELGLGYSQSASFDGEDAPSSAFDDLSTTSGLIRIDGQYGITDALSAGVLARFGSFTTKYDGETIPGFDVDDTKSNATEIGLEVRYHFVNTDILGVFIAPSFGLSNTKADEIPSGADEDDYKNSGTFYGIAAGAEYFFTDNIGANLRLGFGSHNTSDEVDSFNDAGEAIKVDSKSGLAGLEVGVGLVVKL